MTATKFKAALCAAAAFCLHTGASAAPDGALPAEAFGSMPTFQNVAMSPSGQRFFALYRGRNDEEYSFVVMDREDGLSTLYQIAQTDEFRIRRPVWLADDRIVFSVKFVAKRYRTETVETRLLSLNPETGEMERLFRDPRRSTFEMPVQIEDDIVSYTLDDPDTMLVQYFVDGNYDVFRIATEKARKHKRVQRGRDGIMDWQADGTGELRAGRGVVKDKHPRQLVRMPDGDWEDISHRVAEDAPGFRFVGFPHARDKAFVASQHETDTAALYIYDIPSDSFEKRLFHDDAADVYDVIQRRSDGAALGAVFAGDDDNIHWFGDNFVRDVYDRLKNAFRGMDVTLRDLNAPQTHATVFVEPNGQPGTYVLYDIAKNTATRLPPQYPAIADAEADLGPVLAVNYEARDGLTIPAFVTLPPGMESLDDAKNIPFVMFPHGGPSGRDFAGFDFWAQFVASRGYGVMQMNFRGSTGYGETFRAAGDRQWGQAMQDDIEDGANWLIDQGHADPARTAIMGGSYGGYAALMGVVKTPDLYNCAAAFAPVTDLPRLLDYADNYIGGKFGTRHIGRLWSDRSMLRENSPALHADQIKAKVLLVHGEDDRVVDIDQSKRMVTGMKRQGMDEGKDYWFVELEKGTHHLTVGDNRLTFLRHLDTFLGSCMGE